MTDPAGILAIDQGTTSTRAILFDVDGAPRAAAQRELSQIFPRPGWVEHDPEEIWRATVAVCRQTIAEAAVDPSAIAAIGITNQRETTVLWERDSGRPIHNAIVWQDRRTAERCTALIEGGHQDAVAATTGLLIDPYFSATKIEWLLDNVEGAHAAAARGALAFGTIDSFLLWRLTGGRRHATDATNAARTLLFDIHRQEWAEALLALFNVPRAILPEVCDTASAFGVTEAELFGAPIPITGIAGDQQAATIGQACLTPGMVKCTYGTGAFALLNTGAEAVASRSRLLTTVAYRIDGRPTYALEGSIFVAGAAMQWLRDGLGLFDHVARSAALAGAADPDSQVYFVPAFTGLGAPHWDPDARGAILGLTRDTGAAEVTRAGLDAVAFQTRDLMEAMGSDGAEPPLALRIDGGMAANDWFLQRLSDILGLPVERPVVVETTAQGAARVAGAATGFYPPLDQAMQSWSRDRLFEPEMSATDRDARYAGWRDAVRRVRGQST
ncbi:MAG: glycerol kinase GlpK [Alphaproteobacteria bacterium]|jgi:glycerol kinase|nr:glycerol kinase GlpK [Alphaproteobacteria bacterium]MDP6516286.1 glycerol kinase GlpK [Alphaproteobacteria bacterium]